MNNSVWNDPLGRRLTLSDLYEQFQKALQTYAADEATSLEPVQEEDPLLRVLIVDDYRPFTNTLANLVSAWGHDVQCAYDGVTGLALATKYQPDVLLLDTYLPGMSGIELTLQVRQQKRLKHCFIIAVTGRTDSTHSSRCYEAGVDLFLTKPIRPSNMQTLLMLEAEHAIQAKAQSKVRTGGSQLTKIS
jgi:two-component system, OmpR family, alkaline phosphatase synthesis response regulator PhoP